MTRDKESACQCRRHGCNPSIGKIPWRRNWQSTPVFLPGKSHGQRSLAGYSPWGCKRVRHELATKQQEHISYIFQNKNFISKNRNHTSDTQKKTSLFPGMVAVRKKPIRQKQYQDEMRALNSTVYSAIQYYPWEHLFPYTIEQPEGSEVKAPLK